MATTITRNLEQAVTLATTVTQLTGFGSPPPRTLLVSESDVDVYVVVKPGTADGDALPSTGRVKFKTTDMPITYDVSPYGFIGLAGSAAGTCRVELR